MKLFAIVFACAMAMCCFAGCSSVQNSSIESGKSEGFSSVVDVETGGSSKAQAASREIEQKIASMTLEQKVSQLFIVLPGVLDELDGGDGDSMQRYPVGGFLIQSYLLESPDQTRELLANLQQRSRDSIGLPAFCCVDEEGGTVSRVADSPAFGVDNVGNMADIGATGNVEAARDAAVYIGSYLHDLGFNVDFAPVADLASGNDSMALRSFGDDANLTSRMVVAQVKGFADTGTLCSLKHFPGIGGIEEDSHEVGIYSHLSMGEFRAGPLVPFAAGIESGAPFVMIGHLSTPEATGDDVPASLSRAWINGVLRGEMGFDGVVITDSLGMGAVYERYSQYELGALCLEAGSDMLLNPTDFSEMYQGVLDAVARGELSEARIDEALAHVLQAKKAMQAI